MTEIRLLIIIVFLFAITIGSFLNVCIYRIPRGEDIVHTNSHCMNCGYKLAWYDLIPIFSWIFLRGRCRKCGEKISVQYPLIELANGLLWVGLIYKNGFTVTGICYAIAASSLLVLSVIDWRTFEIPVGCNIVIGTAGLVNLWFNRQDWLTYMIGLLRQRPASSDSASQQRQSHGRRRCEADGGGRSSSGMAKCHPGFCVRMYSRFCDSSGSDEDTGKRAHAGIWPLPVRRNMVFHDVGAGTDTMVYQSILASGFRLSHNNA